MKVIAAGSENGLVRTGGLTALGIYAIGELISLLINIEENTRFTALIVRDRMQPPQPSQPVAQPPYQLPAQPTYQPPYQPPTQQQTYQAPIVPPSQPPIPPQSQTPTIQVPPPYEPPQS